ncbi:MAG: hypothetical protein JXR59_04080 [Desulfuromonadaceae bacterium]|nr:hypothetical protein [Desulfuromonadaceae bacterium]
MNNLEDIPDIGSCLTTFISCSHQQIFDHWYTTHLRDADLDALLYIFGKQQTLSSILLHSANQVNE